MEIIGIDAGATWIKAGRFREDLKLLQQVKQASGAVLGVEEYLDTIRQAISQVVRPATSLTPTPDFKIGLGLPGMFSKDGQQLLYTANVRGLGVASKGIAIAEIASRLGVPHLVAANDAKCAALAEWTLGAGQGNRDTRLLHVTWGTGIGTGFIVDGKIQFGWEGGHIPFEHGSELEEKISVPHLVRQSKLTAAHLRTAAGKGDPVPEAILTEAVYWLAHGLRTMAVIGYPDIITIGGAFANDWLINQLRQAIAKPANHNGFAERVLKPEMIRLGQLGNKAGIIGAALLAQA